MPDSHCPACQQVYDSSLEACPNCHLGESTEDERRGTSRWRRLPAKPIFWVGIGVLGFYATMICPSFETFAGNILAFIGFVTLISSIIIVAVLWSHKRSRKHPQKTDEKTPGENEKEAPERNTQPAWVIILLVWGYLWWSGRLPTFPFFSQSPTPLKSSDKTTPGRSPVDLGAVLRKAKIKRQAGPRHQAYWRATIYQLYPKDDGNLKPEDSAFDFIDRFVKDTEVGLIQAKAASKQHIDADVVKLVDQYIELSEEILNMLRPLRKDFRERLGDMTVKEMMEEAAAFDGQITDDQIAQMPDFERRLLEVAVFLAETEQQLLHDIEIMQARLSERYKGVEFPLPESTTATVSE